MNDLRELQEIVAPAHSATYLATVVDRVDDDRVMVRLPGGKQLTISGTASVGDRVMFRNEQLLARVRPGLERTVLVP